jgi:hypothetical protein
VPQEQHFRPAAFELAFLSIEPLVLLPSRVKIENFARRLWAIVQIHHRPQSTTISDAPRLSRAHRGSNGQWLEVFECARSNRGFGNTDKKIHVTIVTRIVLGAVPR